MLNFCRDFGTDEEVEFYIGTTAVFWVYRSLIRHESTLFRDQLLLRQSRGISDTPLQYYFVDENPAASLTILCLLRHHDVQASVRDSIRHLDRGRAFILQMIDVYILARKLSFHSISNIAIEFLGRAYARNSLVPTILEFDRVYASQHTFGTGIRHFMARYFGFMRLSSTDDACFRGNDALSFEDLEDTMRLYPTIRADSMEMLRETIFKEQFGYSIGYPESDCICRYHDHVPNTSSDVEYCFARGHNFDCRHELEASDDQDLPAQCVGGARRQHIQDAQLPMERQPEAPQSGNNQDQSRRPPMGDMVREESRSGQPTLQSTQVPAQLQNPASTANAHRRLVQNAERNHRLRIRRLCRE